MKEALHDPSLGTAARRYHFWVYTAMFRTGPGEYKRAYKAFLAELRATCDEASAREKHLLALDQRKLLKAAQSFAKRLKVPRRRAP